MRFDSSTFLFTLALAAAGTGILWGQHHDMKPAVERPVALYKGMGVWHHAMTTRSAEAQKYFDQGLALLYGFNRYEALRSFQKASQLDPAALMPYWGMAHSLGPYVNMDGDPSFDLKASCTAVEAGRKAATAAPEAEREYLGVAATWCPEYRPAEHIRAAKALAEKYPDDLDAQTLYAESLMIPIRWRWYGHDGRPAEGMAMAESALEQVLRRWPDHAGANHFYIHAVESSPTPERAIPSAQRLMGITPRLGHMVHMPGHIWLVLGDYELASTVNERASAVDREYMDETNIRLNSYTPYYLHNLHFVVYARSMQGHRAEALQAADMIAKASGALAEMIPEMADSFTPQAIFARVRTLAWDAVLAAAAPPASAKLPMSQVMWRYGRALAQLAKGNRAAAATELDAFEQAAAKTKPDAAWGQNKAGDILTLAREILAARFAGSPDDALPHWRNAIAIQDRFIYDEPPAWYYPIRESLGGELLRARRPAEAEGVLREGLKRSPRNGYILFGLMDALKAQGKDTSEVKREFDAVWSKSDVKLSIDAL